MPNGHDHHCAGLVEQAEFYVNRVKQLEKQVEKLRNENDKLSQELSALKATIKLLNKSEDSCS